MTVVAREFTARIPRMEAARIAARRPRVWRSAGCSGLARAWPLVAIVLAVVTAPPVLAMGDGVLEINQICAVNTGCFPGDAAGFPVTIDGSAGSSYRLAGNLTVTDPFTGGIEILANGVTLDLNGFAVVGPSVCSGLGSSVSCSPGSTGFGVKGLAGRITVRNGRARGFQFGVRLGDRAQVHDVIAESNTGTGIEVNTRSLVSESIAYQNAGIGIWMNSGSTAQGGIASSNGSVGLSASTGSSVLRCAAFDNGGDGINAGSGSVVRDNTAYLNEQDGVDVLFGALVSDNASYSNGGDGIEASGASAVQRNTVRSNGQYGLDLDADTAYRENVVVSNTLGSVDGGLDLGDNSCNGTTSCP